jgi:hypothetical protein
VTFFERFSQRRNTMGESPACQFEPGKTMPEAAHKAAAFLVAAPRTRVQNAPRRRDQRDARLFKVA